MCGHHVSPEASTCPNCGHPQPAQARRVANWFWVIAAAVAAVVLILAFMSSIQTANSNADFQAELDRANERCHRLYDDDAGALVDCLQEVFDRFFGP